MMSPMSPLPRMTARRPTERFCRFTRCCTTPAVYTPAGRVPATPMAPRVRSRQPVASSTAPACTVCCPPRATNVTRRSGVMAVTMAEQRISTPGAHASRRKRATYSGPVSASENRSTPKPSWMHWFKMPPTRSLRSSTSTSGTPRRRASAAAASPAGPAPMMTRLTFRMAAPPAARRRWAGRPPF